MSASYFNETQLRVIESAADAAMQAFTGAEAEEIMAAIPASSSEEHKQRVRKLIGTKFSDIPNGTQLVAEAFQRFSPPNLKDLALSFTLLSTTAGTFMLTGHAKPFPDLTIAEREAVLRSWSCSALPMLRRLFRGIVAVSMNTAYTDPEVALATGFPALGDPHRDEDTARTKAHHNFVFERATTPYQTFDTDVLVVGSGAGGGVVSSELSEKGWNVFVVEKGVYQKPEEMPGTPKDGFEQLYEGKGLMATEDGSMNVLAGATFGGGTTVNWSAALRPQHFLREQWAKGHNLPYFLSKEFANSIDAVCERMVVTDKHIKHNIPNQKLMEASAKLGYPCTTIPQNTGGTQHWCGHCGFGCVYGEKQSGPVCWLRRAAENGGKFMVQTNVERLLFAKDRSSPAPTQATLDNFWPTASRRVCVGALVQDLQSGEFAIIRAKQAVVVSAGSINSPAVLMKSGLRNPRIGKNLHLHPTTYITGTYAEEIKPWDGGIMTTVSTVQENWDGTHHGVKLEVIQSFPGGRAASFHPWRGALDHKKAQVQFGNTFTIIPIARDRGSGSIVLDADGVPRMDYSIDPYDARSLLRGIIASCEIHLIAGATRITTPQIAVEDYYPAPGHKFMSDPKWLEWIAKVEKAGVRPGLCGIGSAHQMGSNQMGTKPSNSVVDPRARVWGTESLYIADASVFPTASGVNPMLTNLSLSHSIAQFIDQDLKEKVSQPVQAHL